jgi:hypothetical protein
MILMLACAPGAARALPRLSHDLGLDLVGLGLRRERAMAACEWWNDRGSEIDAMVWQVVPSVDAHAAGGQHPLERERRRAFEEAEARAAAAWDEVLATEARIGDATATDADGLLIQALILADRRAGLGYLDDDRLVHAMIRGLEAMASQAGLAVSAHPAGAGLCREWYAAMTEVEQAESALDSIEIASWARTYPSFVSDPARRARVEAEQRRTGWEASLERLWAAQGALQDTEARVGRTDVLGIAGLLDHARALARRLSLGTHPRIDATIMDPLVCGLEAMRDAPALT